MPRASCQVRAVAIHGDYAVSGSWDRTARLWSLATGQCARVLKHEVQVDILTIYIVPTQYLHSIYTIPTQVRCLALDGHRILTGDVEGYVYAWDLDNCLDPGCGPEKLCLRAHNAMDPDLYCKVGTVRRGARRRRNDRHTAFFYYPIRGLKASVSVLN